MHSSPLQLNQILSFAVLKIFKDFEIVGLSAVEGRRLYILPIKKSESTGELALSEASTELQAEKKVLFVN